MNLPRIESAEHLRGLYVYDFGEWAAVGYTAEEIAVLLDSEAYRGGKVYRIHRATPDGHLELRGVAPVRFQVESGLFFYRARLDEAQADFAALLAGAERAAPPCRAVVHLAQRPGAPEHSAFVTALIFPGEYDDAVAQWLLAQDFRGGDRAEGGVSHVSNYYAENNQIIERHQLWSRSAIPSRRADEVLASVRKAVQR
jgi:hypothetical protein